MLLYPLVKEEISGLGLPGCRDNIWDVIVKQAFFGRLLFSTHFIHVIVVLFEYHRGILLT